MLFDLESELRDILNGLDEYTDFQSKVADIIDQSNSFDDIKLNLKKLIDDEYSKTNYPDDIIFDQVVELYEIAMSYDE